MQVGTPRKPIWIPAVGFQLLVDCCTVLQIHPVLTRACMQARSLVMRQQTQSLCILTCMPCMQQEVCWICPGQRSLKLDERQVGMKPPA